MKTCCVCGNPIEKGQKYFNGPNNRGPAKHQTCSTRNGKRAITDSERIMFLEQTVLGTGKSKFLKSVFITRRLGGDDILLDIHTEEVEDGATLRDAIDKAIMKEDSK